MKTADILIKNANEIITLKGPNKPRVKEQMNKLSVVKNGSVAIKDGLIFDIGKRLKCKAIKTIDAKGKVVMPGFVDPHTHLVFAGSREFELDWKLKGLSYLEILNKGGGINYTVKKTRKASISELISQSLTRLNSMCNHGTTTCEAKSGYGLETKTELKILKVIKKLNDIHPIDIIPTFMGAHSVPKNYKTDEYVTLVIDEMLPKVSKYANFCDVFCEKGIFSPKQTKKILLAGKKIGLIPKIHADEIKDTGGAKLAAEIGAISADHLLMSNNEGLKQMAKNEVMGIMLPGTPFSLMMKDYASARKIIDLGVPVALATDLNPNCWLENMQFIIQLACYKMNMTPAEALCAATFNAACSIAKQDLVGSIERGKQADILIVDCPSYLFIPYHFGINHVETVIKKGCIFT